ncbi:MAG: monofunctional biosynthetic peptidoglycan transglycosylase [Woeseiaceae bacterium]|nr:monofunctional biosynthetic peptidoglycan transglycosylase [Woeseiaceae bacterium]
MPSRRRSKQRFRKPKRRRWLRWIASALIACLVMSALLVLPLRWIAPQTTAFMLQDDSGRVPVLYEWTDWAGLGDAAPLAVVAAEDQRFADHPGLDFESISRSLERADQGGRLRGASTISQQVIKNLYLWPGRSYLRKGVEAYLTVVAELCLPKRRILEIYLNIAELGPGIYGFPAASRYFFDKPVTELTYAEAALLAGVLPNPDRLRADRPSDYLRERQRWILGQVQRLDREDWLSRIQR